MWPPLSQTDIDRMERQRLGLPEPPSRIDGGYLLAWAVTVAWLVMAVGLVRWMAMHG
jgi:hypothetical protein